MRKTELILLFFWNLGHREFTFLWKLDGLSVRLDLKGNLGIVKIHSFFLNNLWEIILILSKAR